MSHQLNLLIPAAAAAAGAMLLQTCKLADRNDGLAFRTRHLECLPPFLSSCVPIY